MGTWGPQGALCHPCWFHGPWLPAQQGSGAHDPLWRIFLYKWKAKTSVAHSIPDEAQVRGPSLPGRGSSETGNSDRRTGCHSPPVTGRPSLDHPQCPPPGLPVANQDVSGDGWARLPLVMACVREDPGLRRQQGRHFPAARRNDKVNSMEQDEPQPSAGSQARTADKWGPGGSTGVPPSK